MKQHRLMCALSGTLVSAVLVSACSQGLESTQPTVHATGQTAVPTATDASPVGAATAQSTPPSSLPGRPEEFKAEFAEKDSGYKFTVDFTVYPMLKAGDRSLASYFPGGAPCAANSETDAVFAGTMSMTDDTPGFSTTASIAIDTSDGVNLGTGDMTFGGDYSNGARCITADALYENYIYSGTFNGHWGPVPVEFVIHNAYSPGSPKGDISTLENNFPDLGALSLQNADQYTAEPVTKTTSLLGFRDLLLNFQDLIP